MTDLEIAIYYSDLLIYQYRDKPKAVATVTAFVEMLVSGQLPLAVQNAFDINTAVGKQLDVIGKYAGVTRDGYSFTGPMTLDDEDYRKILKLKIIKNNSGSSLYEIKNLLAIYFAGQIRVFDYKDMSMSYYVNSSFGSRQLVEFFIKKDLLPSPMAVGVGATIFDPNLKFFSFRTYYAESKGYPFNTYTDYNETWPWLTYKYALESGSQITQNLLTQDGQNLLTQSDLPLQV